MKMLKKQPGLPFLLALGVLLILSASFLAVQLWSDNVFRGAAEALEAPLLPPSMPPVKKGRSRAALDKNNEKAKIATAVEVVAAPEIPKEKAIPAKEELVPLEKPKLSEMMEAPALTPNLPTKASQKKARAAKAKESATADKALKSVPVKSNKEVLKPVKTDMAADVRKIEERAIEDKDSSFLPAVAKVSPPAEVNAAVFSTDAKTVKKPVVAKKSESGAARAQARREKIVEEVDESVVPPEWNWFNVPLKIEMSNGQVAIVSAGSHREVAFNSVVVSFPANLSSDLNSDDDDNQSEPAAGISLLPVKPFATALARMTKLRYDRLALVKENPELVKAIARQRYESLERLHAAVVALCGKLDKSEQSMVDYAPSGSILEEALLIEVEPTVGGAAAEINIESGVLADDATVVDEADSVEYKLVPYYSGSGTRLSRRINDLLNNGFAYNSK